jgi:hypothetical protein
VCVCVCIHPPFLSNFVMFVFRAVSFVLEKSPNNDHNVLVSFYSRTSSTHPTPSHRAEVTRFQNGAGTQRQVGTGDMQG